MVITLYEALKDVEELKEDQERSAGSLLEKLESRRKQLRLPKIFLELDFPSVDVPSAQREIFRQYENNVHLQRAISGELSLEDTVLVSHLKFRVRGRIGSLFPYRKNENHNKIVEGLSELVPDTSMLRTRGILSLDNVINASTIVASSVFAFFYFIAKMSDAVRGDDVDYEMDILLNYAPYLLSGFSAFAMGSIITSDRSESFGTTLKAALYIDDKIKELFPRK